MRKGTEIYLSEAQNVRSVFFFFNGTGPFEFDAGRLKCYSFELVNTSSQAIFNGDSGDQILIQANSPATQNRLNFPVIGYYTRDDIISFNFGFVIGTCYVRSDVKINDQEDPE